MTRCVLYLDAAGRYQGFSIKGHSGYADEGSDIVCAGISALALTADHALERLADISPVETGGEDGFLEVLLPPGLSPSQMHDAQLLLGSLHIGLENIAQAYPGYVRLTTRKVR